MKLPLRVVLLSVLIISAVSFMIILPTSNPAQAQAADVCDNQDNDGDGLIDEENSCFLAPPIPVGAGNFKCRSGQCVTCLPNTGNGNPDNATADEQTACYDQADNDCDGQVDECNPGTSCYLNRCCPAEAFQTPNVGVGTPGDEPCDGQDNDGDGFIDEVNSCFQMNNENFRFRCQNGVCQTCVGGADENEGMHCADQIDNDCDGQVDECNDGESCVGGVCCPLAGATAANNPGTPAQAVAEGGAEGDQGASPAGGGCQLLLK